MTDSTEGRFEDADESVARRFSRLMNATTSRFGVLSDPVMIGVATAPLALLAMTLWAFGSPWASLAGWLAPVPAGLGLATGVGLSGARRGVVQWLAGLPFAVDNMNALLNGMGEELEITFREAPPDKAPLNERLDQIDGDCFVTEVHEDPPTMRIRVGVFDSKRNPARTHYLRYQRVRYIVDAVLRPLHDDHPIESVWIR